MSDTGKADDRSVTQEQALEMRRVRPTLFIGLGGTGAAILTALRRRILQRQWGGHRLESLDDFKVASFLYFDTYAGQAKDQETRTSDKDDDKDKPQDPIAPLVTLREADCIQSGLDPSKYLKRDPIRGTAELDSYPYVKAWLPAEELSSINLEEGAGQIRAMSRLLFFDRIRDINSQISSRVRQLRNNLSDTELLRYLGLETTGKVNVKIIGSAAGGTGSGAFIDAGYLAKALKDPPPEEVSLYLVLGGAFSGQGPRVLANTYAALAEIEYSLKLRYGDRPFVDTWDGTLEPSTPRPYDRLYLFDSSNTAGVGVNQQGREFVFRMIADLLMQEFAEPDLVGARRGDLSNQDTKYREPMYSPTVLRQYKGQGLEYSRLYSGIGQSTVETRGRIEVQAQSAEVAIGMLRAYFRIDGSQAVAPKPVAIEEFLSERLFLGPPRQFTVHKDLRNPPVLSDYPLIFSRLLAKDGASLLEGVQNDIARDFQRLMESPLSEWPTRAQDIKHQRRSEIEQDSVDRLNLTTRTRLVDDSYRRLTSEIISPEGTLRQGILRLIDADIGGIAYAEQFVDAIKARIAAHWIPLFRRDADTFGELSTRIMSQLYDQAAENLQKEAKGSIFSKPSQQRMETIVNQLKDTLTTWMQYRLRQIACMRAADLLQSVDVALGEPVGVGPDGGPQFSGVLRDIHDGLATVEATIEDLNFEARLIRDPDTAHNPIHQVIGAASAAPDLSIAPEVYRALAAKAFESYGGATRLFLELKERRKRAEVLNKIRRVASEEDGPSGRPILPAEEDIPGLIDELHKIPRAKQEEVISRAVSQAMPWVNINKRQIACWNEDMNSIFVCVRDTDRFKSEFGSMVEKAVAAQTGGNKEVNYIKSTTQGRLLICTELSGLPLDGMVQLHDEWFRQYEQTRDDARQAPLHTHKEWEKFARPTAPDASEMRARLDDLALFIQGVCFGTLRRRTARRFPNAPDKVGQYEINLSAGLTANNWVPIGRELKIKNFGLRDEHRAALEKEIRTFTADLSPSQVFAATALFEYYTQYHYAPSLVGKDEEQRAGLGHLSSEWLVDMFRHRLEETPEGREFCGGSTADSQNGPELGRRLKTLLDKLDDWTTEIEGSLDDVDGLEANKDPKTEPSRRARPKRTIRPEIFCDEAALKRLIAGGEAKAKKSADDSGGDVRLYWYIGPDGKAVGHVVDAKAISRLVAEGVVTPGTKLCAKGTKAWREAADWPEFAELFEGPPPLDEETPPPMNE
ncbi:MAG: hypothetical protein GC166_04460 [Alphaproteobacteria bacterium]|nr:hypothetical protein [Alphaproteobacteria bacterium]